MVDKAVKIYNTKKIHNLISQLIAMLFKEKLIPLQEKRKNVITYIPK